MGTSRAKGSSRLFKRGQKDTTTALVLGVTNTETDNASWLGTARLRAGFAGDRLFFYGTGGIVYRRLKEDGAASGFLVWPHFAYQHQTGWTVGTRAEAGLAEHWTARLEYLYASFGGFSNTYAVTGGRFIVNYPRINENIIRAGLNYRF